MLNSNLKKTAAKNVYTIEPGATIELTTELPNAYICSTKGTDSTSQSMIVGAGYGRSSVRHSISELISSAYIVYVVNEETYGLSITNNASWAITVGIVALM